MRQEYPLETSVLGTLQREAQPFARIVCQSYARYNKRRLSVFLEMQERATCQVALSACLVAARFTLRSRHRYERLVWDAVLSEEEAQVSRVFLDVAQIVQQ
jgi:hypothetical protein